MLEGGGRDCAPYGCVAEGFVGESGGGGEDANARRRCEREKIGRRVRSPVSMWDTDTLLVLGLRGAGCVNGTREAEGIICRVVNDVDERT
jgi:hypothetical protein